MIAAPALDLRQGRCVQLVGGRPEDERVPLPDPVAQARRWWDTGFGTLHVVDLDAALSLGDNRTVVREILQATEATVQVGGGIRDEAAVADLLEAGAGRVIIGTRALDDPEWLRGLTEKYPGIVLVAADTRGGQILRKGWTEGTGIPVLDFLRHLDPLPLAGVLCTDVGREGRMEGSDLEASRLVIGGTRHPVWISGGVTTMEELRTLDAGGAAGAVRGMSIYTGVLPAGEVAREFGK
ncbi:MAG: 1-(5-phosphoribosyl)-5-[(5-phosphoribosylamino)methylideneamino]imidazole-4-carboxamide isomerase [Longimicrobiales bacterium]